jgi:tRNA1Val (adenine37-N6)-methyltransferase
MRRFHFKHFSLCHDASTMKVGTDAVLLGAWASLRPGAEVLDIGCGCGVLSLMMAQKGAGRVDAVDLDEASAREAASNFEASQWRDRLYAFCGDIRRFGYGRRYDLILTNPPFYAGLPENETARRNQTRHAEATLSFNELAAVAKHLLKPDGRFVLVLPERQSPAFLSIARQYKLVLKRQQLIIPIEGRDPNRVNLELSLAPNSFPIGTPPPGGTIDPSSVKSAAPSEETIDPSSEKDAAPSEGIINPSSVKETVPLKGNGPTIVSMEGKGTAYAPLEENDLVETTELVLRDGEGRFTAAYYEAVKDFYLG